jgi:hypothetical protein
MADDSVKELVRFVGGHVEILNLDHCYWLSGATIQWAVSHCPSLTELHLLECRIKIDKLVQLVASCSKNLCALSFSVQTFEDLKKDVFKGANETLKHLRQLKIYYSTTELTMMKYLGEHPTILDYCEHLEQLDIQSAGMSVPELYRPIITHPQNHLNLTYMAITSNIHAAAQMMFYGTLSQLPNAELKWTTLLMPNVNFLEFARKQEFRNCLKHIECLKNLDVSGSKVRIPLL